MVIYCRMAVKSTACEENESTDCGDVDSDTDSQS
jgi:hypothetical protein